MEMIYLVRVYDNEYPSLRTEYENKITEYNALVSKYNSLVEKYNNLIQEVDSHSDLASGILILNEQNKNIIVYCSLNCGHHVI